VRWLDEQGIAMQAVITGEGYTLARAIRDPKLGMQALTAVNTWMSDALADHSDRLLPVTCLRFEDLDWVVAEMTRMRERGSRTFLITSEPVNNIPVTHPAYDRVWDAATDLGMVAHLHIGMSPSMYHPGWANTDDPALIRLISVLQPHQTAQVMLNAMVFGGVFERHPTLTVLLSELGVDWVPGTVARMDALAAPGMSPLVLGDYRLPMAPSEYVRRNIRVSPLPAAHESPIAMLESIPEVAVFSSDYPHFEGSPDPVGHYRELLRDQDAGLVEGFLGGSIAECFARMGDPLPLPTGAPV
jgi:predicted TIM-barrel fold metal-dependent hydrolase